MIMMVISVEVPKFVLTLTKLYFKQTAVMVWPLVKVANCVIAIFDFCDAERLSLSMLSQF